MNTMFQEFVNLVELVKIVEF